MRKNYFFFKSLLLATVLLLGSANAWATDVPYSVGTSTDATYLSAASDIWEMAGDGVLTVTFTNHCKTDASNWFNWHLICGNSSDSPAAGDDDSNRYFVMRADRWENIAGDSNNFWVSDNYFTDFMTWSNGATITLKVVRYGTTVNVYITATKEATTYTMGYVNNGIPDDETIKFYLTGSQSYMEITAQNVSTTVAGEEMTNAYMSFNGASITGSYNVVGEVGTMTWPGQWTATPSIDTNMFRVGNMNDGTVALVGEAAGAKDIVTITFDLGVVGLINKSVEFKVTDVNSTVLVDEEFCKYGGTFTEGKNTLGFAAADFVSQNANDPGMVANTKNTFTLTFNYATGKIFGSVTNKNGTVNKQIDMPVGAGAIASFAVRSNYNNASRRCYFDNLKITTEIGDYAAVSTTYTVKYKSGGVEVKDESTGRVGDVGATPVLEASDTETFYSVDGEHKYVYASDNASTTTIEAGGVTVVTVNFTDYAKRDYTVNAVDKANTATVLKEIATGYVYTDATTTDVNLPWYVLYNGTLYYDGKDNRNSITVESDNQIFNVEYEATDKTDVIYYEEGENLGGRIETYIASNYAYGRDVNDVLANVSRGSYKVVSLIHVGNGTTGNDYQNVTVTVGDVAKAKMTKAKTNNQTIEIDVCALENCNLSVAFAGSNNSGMDYVYVQRTNDDPTIPVKIESASGFATLYTPYALDFENSTPSGLKAYTATLTTETVDLTEVDNVPAETGVVLKGAATTYTVPVLASSSTAKGSLEGTASASTAYNAFDAAGYYIYGLALNKDDATKAEFAKITSGSVAAGKAFLKVSKSLGSKVLRVVDGEASEVVAPEVVEAEGEEILVNLAGIRVGKDYKGVVINQWGVKRLQR